MTSEYFRVRQYCPLCGKELPSSSSMVEGHITPSICADCQQSTLLTATSFQSSLGNPINTLVNETQYQYNLLKTNYMVEDLTIPNFVNRESISLNMGITGDMGNILGDVGILQQGILDTANFGSVVLNPAAFTVADTNLAIVEALSAITVNDKYLNYLTAPSYSGWLKPDAATDVPAISVETASRITGVLGTTIAADNALLTYDPEKLYNFVGTRGDIALSSIDSLGAMTIGYRTLWTEPLLDYERLVLSSSLVIERPPLEIYQAGILANVIAPLEVISPAIELPKPPKVIKTPIDIRDKILSLGRQYLDIYDGAVEAIHTHAKDSQRQGCISLRELFTHAMQQLAPDKSTLEYLGGLGNADDYIYNGRPTRKGRLKYISRNIDNPKFREFLGYDIEAALSFFNLLQQGTHSLMAPYNDEQILAILSRAEGLISFLVDISRE